MIKRFPFSSKYFEKVIQVQRVTKVIKGGRKLTFRATMAISYKKNRTKIRMIGLGIGKANNFNLAITKALIEAKKNLIYIFLSPNKSISRYIIQKFGAVRIMLCPAQLGTGIIAGGAIRSILELSGIRNIFAKQYGSTNLLNNAKATILALSKTNS